MNRLVSMDDIAPIMREKINAGGQVSFTPKGFSMLPMLRNNKDTVTLIAPDFPLKKYDIPLYVRDDGKYVLHRVVNVNGHTYTMRGDNQLYNENGIRDEQIIGVVSGFTRKEKVIKTDKLSYRVYCVVWVNTILIRKLYKKVRRFLGKIKRKVLRKR